MISKNFFIILLSVIFFTVLDLYSLDVKKDINSFIYDCYDSSKGMPQNSANSFAVNSKDFVYIATQEGVIKYDGHKMDIFDRSNLKSLPSNNIRDILVMEDDSVYVATAKGLIHYTKNAEIINDFKKHSFIKGKNVSSISASHKTGTIYGLVPKQFVFAITPCNKILFFKPVSELEEVKDFDKIFFSNYHNSLYLTAQNGLFKFEDDTFKKVPGISETISDISESKDGTIYVTGISSLYEIKQNNEIVTYGKKDGLELDNLSSVMVDSKDSVWVGSVGSGFTRFVNNEFQQTRSNTVPKLQNVLEFFEDPEGNIWIGTETNGFCIVKDGIVKDTYLKDHIILNISGDSGDNIWANVEGYGAAEITPGRKTTFHTEKIGKFLLSVFVDSKKRVWVSSKDKGVFISHDQKHFTPLTDITINKNKEVPLNTSVFFEDSKKTVWFNGRNNPSKIFFVSENSLSSRNLPVQNSTIVDIKENLSGEIIAGTKNDGIFKLDSVTGNFIKINFPKNIFVHNLFIDSKNRLWISTHNDGLMIYVNGDALFLNRQKGVFDHSIHAIMEDDQGNFWFTTNKGLFTISNKDIECFIDGDCISVNSIIFDESDGMLSRECNGGVYPSIFKSSEGNLFIPTIKGIVSIDPTEQLEKIYAPPLSFSWLILNHEYSKRIRYIEGKTLKIPPGTETIEINYSAPSFKSPEKIRFDYALDKNRYAKNIARRFATFTNLEPGKHSFNLKAYFSGAASDKYSEKTLQFEVMPFFYQTKKYQISFFAVLFLLITLIWLIRKRASLAREEEMLRVINEKTYELQLKNNELEEIVMMDPLTGLKNRRYLFEIEEQNLDNFINSKERAVNLSENRSSTLKNDPVYAIIMVDIDHFKKINDYFGHNTGDIVLVEFAKLLQSAVRKEDVVIRWGGEEFLIILKNTKKDKITEVAEKIRKSVEQHQFRTETGKTIWLTASLGITAVPFYQKYPNLMSFESILSITDLALYNSKNKGRDTCTMVLPGKKMPTTREHLYGMLANAQYADLNGFYTFERIKPDNFGEYEI